MKKLLSFALGLSVLVAVVLTGCSSSGSTESGSNSSTASQAQTSTPVDMNVTALKGPTAMGMVKFMNDCEEETITDNNYNFSIFYCFRNFSSFIIRSRLNNHNLS